MVDPNAGLSMYKYDRNGQTTQVWSETGLMSMSYDSLGNMIARDTWTDCLAVAGESDCTSWDADWKPDETTKSSSATWTYDYAGSSAANAPKGALIQTTSTTVFDPPSPESPSATPTPTPTASPTVSAPANTTFTLTQETTAWDSLHRPAESRTLLPNVAELGELAGESYTRTVTYDDAGRATATSPEIPGVLAEQRPEVTYNRFGTPTALKIINDPFGSSPSTTDVVSGIVQDELGRITDRVYANGVVRSITFSDQWQAPSKIRAWFVDDDEIVQVQDDVFTRDDFGRVVEVDGAMDVTGTVRERQCFVYDGHNRLDQAWTLNPGAAVDNTCDTGTDGVFDFPSAGAGAWNGSAAPYATDWDYSPSGRITQITELVVPAAQVSDETQLTRAFTYGDAAHPHAVTGVEVTDNRTDPNPTPGPQVVDTSAFDYDAAGRQTLRVVDGVTETLTWDVSSNLVKTVVDDGTDQTTWSYLYDASGQRWAKIETPTKAGSTPQATVYLGDTEITDSDTSVNDATADVSAVRYFTFGGATVAMEQAVEGAATVPFFFLFGDYQGSAQVVMPDLRDGNDDYDLAASADAILRNAYTPYGATRSVGFGAGAADAADAQFERGWLSQVADETTATLGTGLTYLNARYYDPISSRFLSPDPLLDVMDPKTLDPYRYADNNPIVFTDATGLWACPNGPGRDACEAMQENLGMGGRTSWRSAGSANSSGSGLVGAANAAEGFTGAAGAIHRAYAADASNQGRLLGQGRSNHLWKYSPNGSGTANGFWANGTGSKIPKAGPVVTTVGFGLDYRDKRDNRYVNISDDDLRRDLSAAHAGGNTAAGVAAGGAVMLLGVLLCGTGVGCVLGVGLIAGGVGMAASYGSDRLLTELSDDQVRAANAAAADPPPWWVDRPDIISESGVPSHRIAGINAPGRLQFPEVLSSAAIEPYHADDGTTVFRCVAG